jgi:hypothetical protein
VLGDSHWSNFFPSGHYLSFVWSQLVTGHSRNSFFGQSCRIEYTNPVFLYSLVCTIGAENCIVPCVQMKRIGHCNGAEEHRVS